MFSMLAVVRSYGGGQAGGGDGAERGLVPTNLAKSQPTHRHSSTGIRVIVRVLLKDNDTSSQTLATHFINYQ